LPAPPRGGPDAAPPGPRPGAVRAPASRAALRRLLAVALLVAAASPLPARAGDEAANDPRVRAVAGKLVCYCGCSTQSMAYCSCDVAQKERHNILADLEAGKTPDEIVAAYVDRFGTRILIEPPPHGFNLVGWLLPSAAVLAAGLLLALQIRRWSRSRPGPEPVPTPASDLDAGYLARLEDELRRRQP
jgi:cytochrome c-type biogenesis protein CcmH